MAEGLAAESQKSLQMEAEMEKHLADCDTGRTQLAGRLVREEEKNEQLRAEVERLKQQLEHYTSQSSLSSSSSSQPVEIKSVQRQGVDGSSNRLATAGSTVPQTSVTATIKGFRNTPPHTPPEARRIVRESPERDTKPVGKSVIYTPASAVANTKSPERTVVPAERPIPAEKPADLSARMAAMSATGTASSQQGPTMFTTPSGTRITVAVGGGAAGRKPVGGRGPVPPPVPPNKPQVVLPAANRHLPQSSSPNPIPPQPKPRFINSSSSSSSSAPGGTNTHITVSNDKITISSTAASTTRSPVSVSANQSNMFQTNTSSGTPDHIARQKAAAAAAATSKVWAGWSSPPSHPSPL